MAAWLRLYAEMMDDPKVGELTDSEFRTWIGLLCLACKAEAEGDTTHTIERANWALRRDIAPDLTHLTALSLIVLTPTKTLQIANWSKRQYRSDSSIERVRKHRAHAATSEPVTEPLPKRSGNALDKSRAEQSRADKESAIALPLGVPAELWSEWAQDRRDRGKPLSARTVAKQLKFLASQPVADRAEIIRTAINQDWQGLWPLKRGGKSGKGQQGAYQRILEANGVVEGSAKRLR